MKIWDFADGRIRYFEFCGKKPKFGKTHKMEIWVFSRKSESHKTEVLENSKMEIWDFLGKRNPIF